MCKGSIGRRAGMTSAALYKHYSSKEEMFCAAVEPLIKVLYERMERHRNMKYQLTYVGSDKYAMFGESSQQDGISAEELEKEKLHMLLSAYFTAVFEPIIHGLPDEKVEKYLARVRRLTPASYHAWTSACNSKRICGDENEMNYWFENSVIL